MVWLLWKNGKNNILDVYKAVYKDKMTFLSHLFHNEDEQYGVITAATLALSTVLPKSEGKIFGKDSRGCRMIKGTYKLRLHWGSMLPPMNQTLF